MDSLVFFPHMYTHVTRTQIITQTISRTSESFFMRLQGRVMNYPNLSKSDGFFQDMELSVLKPRQSWAHQDKLVTLLQSLHSSPPPGNHYSDFYLVVILRVAQMILIGSQGRLQCVSEPP